MIKNTRHSEALQSKKILLVILLLVGIFIVLPLTSAYTCYQETANASNSIDGKCALNYSGSYIDGGCYNGAFSSVSCYLNISYIKPVGATNLSKWRVKEPEADRYYLLANATTKCWKDTDTQLNLTLVSYADGASSNTIITCWNGTSWHTIYASPDSGAYESSITGTNTTIAKLIDGDWTTYAGAQASPQVLSWRTGVPVILASYGMIYEEAMQWDINWTLFENSQTFDYQGDELSSHQFKINFTFNSLEFGVNAVLNFNGTEYIGTTSDTIDTRLYSANAILPSVSTNQNRSFYWTIMLTNGSGTTNYTSLSYNYSILNVVSLDNCSVNTQRLLNFTMLDEDNLYGINGTIEASVNVYSISNNLIASYNNTLDYIFGTASGICAENLTNSSYMTYVIKFYGNSSYFQKYKMSQYSSLTSQQNIVLYNLLQSSGATFKIILSGNTYSTNALLIDAQRQYVSQNSFQSVESSVADSDGAGIAHLVPSNAVYNFVISLDGNVLATLNNYRVQCQNSLTGQCTVTLNLAQATLTREDLKTYGNITGSFLLDKTAKTLYYTFASTDGQAHTVSQVVVKSDAYGNNTVCSSSTYGTSGTLTCAIPTTAQNTSFDAQISSDGVYLGQKQFSVVPPTDWYGADILIELMMFTSVVFLMMSSPILIIIGAIIGFGFSMALLFIGSSSWTALITVIIYYLIAGILIIIQIGKRIF